MKSAFAILKFPATALLFLLLYLSATAQTLNDNRKQLFDYDWKFRLEDDVRFSNTSYDDREWSMLDLPHDWSIEGQPSLHHPSGNDGGYFPTGTGWYRKTFTIPDGLKGKRLSIYFEGVYMNAEVFINDKKLGMHPYGYTSFEYDLTPYLNYNGENTIAVRVDNSMQKNCRWYSGSGIYRHVWLIATNEISVAHWGVSISTPEVNAKRATVLVKTSITNKTNSKQEVMISTLLSCNSTANTGKQISTITLEANEEKEVMQPITIYSPLLWSPETPVLYHATIEVKQQHKSIDRITQSFGIRTMTFTSEKGFQLNGKTVKINGGCVHHDNGGLGAAAYDRAEERKVELLKAAGFNAVRTSHNPPSESFLDACDRLGLLVIDEIFDGWKTAKNKYDYASIFEEWWQRDITAMVKRDRNHPSIMMWSIGNEIIERKEPQAVATAKMLASAIKQIDSTRPVTSAMTTWDKDWEIFDPLMAAHDIAGYNYQLHRAPSDHIRIPSRVIVQTESYPRDAFNNWKLVHDNPYIIGDFVWTAMDYLGESGIGRWYYSGEVTGEHYERALFPWHGAYCGDIDLTGWRKPISHYRSLLYSNKEKLYMAVREPAPAPLEINETLWSVWPTWESWTWPGQEGKDITVEVYSRYPRVRLYINQRLLAEKATTESEQFKASFTLPYMPGEIKAVGIADGQETESYILKTAGNRSSVKLTADKKIITADGQDLSFVTAEIVDESGHLEPNAACQLLFNVTGAGAIAGVSNANLKDISQEKNHSISTWKGRALIVIKSSRQAGEIVLQVSSKELPTATISIQTQAQNKQEAR